jgi:hypothetical protein
MFLMSRPSARDDISIIATMEAICLPTLGEMEMTATDVFNKTALAEG